MSTLKALFRLGAGAVSALLLVAAILAASLARAFRADLIRPEFIVHLAATGIAIMALWKLLAGERAVAARLGAMAVVGFLTANVSAQLPGTWRRAATALREMDRANARGADALETARAVPCATPRFTADGAPRYWWSPDDEPPACYDRGGVHPDTGTPLLPVDSAELFAMVTRRQEMARQAAAPPLSPPSPEPAATPAPAPEAPPAAAADSGRWTEPVRITAHREQQK